MNQEILRNTRIQKLTEVAHSYNYTINQNTGNSSISLVKSTKNVRKCFTIFVGFDELTLTYTTLDKVSLKSTKEENRVIAFNELKRILRIESKPERQRGKKKKQKFINHQKPLKRTA